MHTGVHTGQRLVSVVAAAALGAAAFTSGHYLLLAPTALIALLVVTRWHGRPLLASTDLGTRYLLRRHTGWHRDGLFPLLCPGAAVDDLDIDGTPSGVIRDGSGLVTIIELADGDAVVHSAALRIPAPSTLATAADADGPAITAQMLVVARRPYRRVFATLRAGDDGRPWHDAELRDALTAAVRRARRRAGRLGAVARPLDRHAAEAAVLWATGAPPTSDTVTEAWDHLRIGNDVQVTLDIDRTPDTDLLVRLIRAPASVVAVGWTATRTTVRVSATDPSPLLSGPPIEFTPCDGYQYAAFRATLPLATSAHAPHGTLPANATPPPPPGIGAALSGTPWRVADPRRRAGAPASGGATPDGVPRDTPPRGGPDRSAPTSRGDPGTGPELPATGLMIGVDRTGAPVYIRLDEARPDPVRVAVVGGPVAARILGARLRTLTAGRGVPAPVPVAVSVFEGLTTADGPALARADVVICQPLSPADASLVASVLHLTRAGAWLSRIEGDMVAVISDGAVRWARLGGSGGEEGSRTGLVGVARS